MALVSTPNKRMILKVLNHTFGQTSIALTGMNATGNTRVFIGQVKMINGTGSKTISSAGGAIIWGIRNATTTFVDATSRLRVGLQDLTAAGINDGTFDVYKELVGGVDILTTNTNYRTLMDTGSKTLNDGDLVAIVFEFTVRGGADIVPNTILTVGDLTNLSQSNSFPYNVYNGTKQTSNIGCIGMIEFDDGTIGALNGVPYMAYSTTSTLFSQTSTPDEYALGFSLPFKCAINGCTFTLGSIGTTDTFEAVFYSDPEGTPTVLQTKTIDPNLAYSTSSYGQYTIEFDEQTIEANTWYAISIRPTSNNSIGLTTAEFLTANAKNASELGSNSKLYTRSNQTGAFTSSGDAFTIPASLFISKLDDGVSSSGNVKTINGVPVSGLNTIN